MAQYERGDQRFELAIITDDSEVFVVVAVLLAVAVVWRSANLRFGASNARVLVVLAICAVCVIGSVAIASGYRITIGEGRLSVGATVGGLRFLALPLDGLTHAYRTEMETGAWSPNFSDGTTHPSMPVSRGSAVVLLCDDETAIRIAVSDPTEVLAQLERVGIPTILRG